MRVPTPRELGLPEWLDRWRPGQEEAFRQMMRSGKRVLAPEGPTGFGKTALYVGWAFYTRRPTAVVTESLGLMAQLMEEYESVGAVSLMGRRRYPCSLRPEYTCEDGRAARCPRIGTVGCPLSAAEFKASTSPLVITNYDKWTSARKFGRGFDHIQQVVFDEGHLAAEALGRAMQVVLHDREVETDLQMSTPQTEEMVDWKIWASTARAESERMLLAARALVAQPNPKPTWVRTYVHLRNLTRRLAILATAQPQYWIAERLEKGWQFDPIRVGRYAEVALLCRTPHVIITSATLRPAQLHEIGIGKDHYDYWPFPSDFNPQDAPFYYVPTMRVDRRAESLSALWAKHDQIAARRRDRKGIVHTVSYARASEIRQHSRFVDSMILNAQGEPSTDTVARFKASSPGAILVSPSVGAGFNFPGSECEWQFICKIPFPDSRSKIVRARQEDNPEWAPSRAAMKIQQAAGRGDRYPGDRCETFMGDMHLDWFIPRYRHLFSSWFLRRFNRVEVVPPPPPPL